MSLHDRVPHPRDLFHEQQGLARRDLLPQTGHWLARWNTRLAFAVAAGYGAAATIWLFVGYTLLGVIKPNWLTELLFWSNGVQLVFCAVMTFVGNQLAKGQQAKADADHAALTHIATVGDATAAAVEDLRVKMAALAATPKDLQP